MKLLVESVPEGHRRLLQENRFPFGRFLKWTITEKQAAGRLGALLGIAWSSDFSPAGTFLDPLTLFNWEGLLWTLSGVSARRQELFRNRVMRALPKESYRKAGRFDRTLQKRRELRHKVSEVSFEPIDLVDYEESTAEQLLQPVSSAPAFSETHQTTPMELDQGESNQPRGATKAIRAVCKVVQTTGVQTITQTSKDLIDFNAPNVTGPSEALGTSSQSLLDEDIIITKVEPGKEPESGKMDLVPFFDSHMHLDRLAGKARLGRPYNLSSCMTEMLQRSQPDLKPLYGLTEVTAVFCDPAKW